MPAATAEQTSKTRPVATFDHLMKRRRPEDVVTFAGNEDLQQKLAEAEQEQAMASIGTDKRRQTTARKQLEDARAALLADDDTVQVRLRGMRRGEFDQLMRAHPPSDEQIEEWEAKPDKYDDPRPQYNADTFYPALLAGCAIAPELTVDQAQQLLEEWPGGDVNQLIQKAVRLCNGSTAVDLGK